MSSETAARRAVLDASALVRALGPAGDETADRWLEAVASGKVEAFVPEIAFAETAHALARYVRGRALTREQADEILADLDALPLTTESLREPAPLALHAALELALTVYDAFYLVLAEMLDAVLVTADERLAAVAERSAPLPGDVPLLNGG